MHDFREQDPNEMIITVLADAVRRVKGKEQEGRSMSSVVDEIRAEEREHMNMVECRSKFRM